MGGGTIVIGWDNVPPNTHDCGGQGGTKIIGDLALYTCMKELRRGNSNSENFQYTGYRNPYNNCCFPSQNTPKSMSAGAFPDPTGELTVLPQIPKLVLRGPLRGRRGMEGSGGKD